MSQNNANQSLAVALQHHQAGRLSEAEELYRQILAAEPENFRAMHLLGVIEFQRGNSETAVELISRAIEFNPNWPEAHNNLGNALRQSGQPEQAIAVYRRAIELNSNFADAHYNLANALRAGGQLDDAIAGYQQTLLLRPDFAPPYRILGGLFKSRGQLNEAVAALLRANELAPARPEEHLELGLALEANGQVDQAIDAYRQAIALQPASADAFNNLGNALDTKGEKTASIAAYQQAIAMKPDFALAYSNLGGSLIRHGRLDEAVSALEKAISLQPNFPPAHNNLGNALKEAGRMSEAIVAFRRAIALNPHYVEAHSNLLFSLEYSSDSDAGTIADEQRHWNLLHAEPLRSLVQTPLVEVDANRRVKIGYVSSDFYDHVVGRNILPLLINHNHEQFEIFCYSQVVTATPLTQTFQIAADHWRNIVGVSDEQVAADIRQDKIDILVDLGLHTAKNRLLTFARKPAPLQVSFAGYPGSTGLDAIDYRLSDPYLDPLRVDESEESQKTIRLPQSFWCFDPGNDRDLAVNSLPALSNDIFTFGCLNNFCKCNDHTLDLWSRVLKQVIPSRLLLLSSPGAQRSHTLQKFAEHGIDPQRIAFVPRQSRRRYLETFHQIDLGLDTFPYNGHSTGLDSLWMGVPVVTMIGNRPVSRAGWCHLSNLSMTELAGENAEQFVTIAAGLAQDLPRLQQYRSNLRQRMEQSPLMDAVGFARDIEAIYRRMWHTWCENQAAKK